MRPYKPLPDGGDGKGGGVRVGTAEAERAAEPAAAGLLTVAEPSTGARAASAQWARTEARLGPEHVTEKLAAAGIERSVGSVGDS